MVTPTDALNKAIRLCKGQRALAREVNKHVDAEQKIGQSHVYHWVKVGRVAAEYCRAVEKAVDGKVTRYQLRPDVFGRRRESFPARAAS